MKESRMSERLSHVVHKNMCGVPDEKCKCLLRLCVEFYDGGFICDLTGLVMDRVYIPLFPIGILDMRRRIVVPVRHITPDMLIKNIWEEFTFRLDEAV
ncbi:hypothetical protein C0J52_27074 [Blattella germanica]|nr:hypothetical protein C0J52_27074 [Blattella germanica]